MFYFPEKKKMYVLGIMTMTVVELAVNKVKLLLVRQLAIG